MASKIAFFRNPLTFPEQIFKIFFALLFNLSPQHSLLIQHVFKEVSPSLVNYGHKKKVYFDLPLGPSDPRFFHVKNFLQKKSLFKLNIHTQFLPYVLISSILMRMIYLKSQLGFLHLFIFPHRFFYSTISIQTSEIQRTVGICPTPMFLDK